MKYADIQKLHDTGLITDEQRRKIIEHFQLKEDGGNKFLAIVSIVGTPLYERLKREGRILRDRAWELCTLFDINFQPKNMSVAELQSGFLKLAKQLYSAGETHDRRAKFKRMLKTSPNFGWRVRQRQAERLLAA
jgi:hypothetical protein